MGHTTTALVSVGHQSSAVASVGNNTVQLISVGHQGTASVSVLSALLATPSSVTFAYLTAPTQVVTLNHGGQIATYTASSGSGAIATVTVNGNTLLITPVGTGTDTITVTGSDGSTCSIPVTVGLAAGALTASVSSLAFTANGISTVSFTVSRTNDIDVFTATSQPLGSLNITGGGNGPGPVTFTVSATEPGYDEVIISATDGTTLTIPVTTYGPLAAQVTSPQSTTPMTLEVGQENYSGPFTLSFIGTNTATISPSSANGPSALFTLSDTVPGEYYLLQIQGASDVSPIVFTMQTQDVGLGNVVCTFYDEQGMYLINPATEAPEPTWGSPLPAGVQWQLYYDGGPIVSPDQATASNPSTMLANGYIGVGGTATLPLNQISNYTVTFTGTQAPGGAATFSTGTDSNPIAIVVPNYRSPNFSVTSATVAAMNLWTRGWVNAKNKIPGAPGTTSVAYNFASSLNAILALLDQRQQIVSVSTRLDSCVGNQQVGVDSSGNPIIVDAIQSWLADFFGDSLPRLSGETDANYIARGKAALVGTLQAQVVQTSGSVSGMFEALGGGTDIFGNPYIGKAGVPFNVTCGVTNYPAILYAAQAAWNSSGNIGPMVVFDTTHYCTANPTTGAQPYIVAPIANTPYATYVSTLSLADGQFVVLLPINYSTNYAFIINQSGLGQNTFLQDFQTITTVSPTTLPVSVVNAVAARKALGTYALYAQVHQ